MVREVHGPAVVFRGLSLRADTPATAEPTIIGVDDPDIVGSVLEDLKTAEGRATLADKAVQPSEGNLGTLWQPVHRRHQVVLMEARCDVPGEPPLCRRAIDGAGIVLRRRVDNEAGSGHLGWMTAGGRLRGWQPVDAERDPLLLGRTQSVPQALKRLQRLGLETNDDGMSEDVTPLFIAPPEVNEALGTLCLFAVVSVANPYMPTPESRPETLSEGFAKEILPQWLRRAPKVPMRLRNRVVRFSDSDGAVQDFKDDLRLLFQSGGLATEAGASLKAHLNTLLIAGTEPLADFLDRAFRLLINNDTSAADNGNGITFPDEWVAPSTAHQDRSGELLFESLDNRWNEIAPAGRRFDNAANRFDIAAFCRVHCRCLCAPRAVWAKAPAGPFRVAPWFESSGAAPVVIDLPEIGSGDDFAKMKPNVAFALPPGLQEMLGKMNLGDLMDGKKPSSGGGLGLGWICGFNIPIITLCAFIVLYIFISLLNFIFWWIFYIKICIPFPMPAKEED